MKTTSLILLCAVILCTNALALPARAAAALSPPANLQAASALTTISLTWSAVAGAAKYNVYNEYDFGLFSAPIVIGTVTSASYSVTVPLTTKYKISVSSIDTYGIESNRSLPVAVTTALDTAAPTMNGATVLGRGISWNAIGWSAATDNYFGLGSYEVYRDGVQIVTVSNFVRAYKDENVGDEAHTYQVYARDQAGNRSQLAASLAVGPYAVGTDATAPSSPSAITKMSSGSSNVLFKWNQSTDNIATTGYFVFRDGVHIATVAPKPTATTANYWDRTVSAGTQYAYQVAAFDAAGNLSAMSASVSFEIVDANPPSVGSLAAHVSVGGQLTSTIPLVLNWLVTEDSANLTLQGAQIRSSAGIMNIQSALAQATYGASADMTIKAAAQSAAAAPGAQVEFLSSAVDGSANVGTGQSRQYVPALVQDIASASLVYSTKWNTANSSIYSGGSTHYSTTAGASATYTFTGRTDVAWVGRRLASGGIADIYLDGVKQPSIDCYASKQYAKSVLYEARNLNPLTTHTLQIIVTGTKNVLATGKRIEIDGFVTL